MDGFEDNEGRISRLDIDHFTYLGIYFPNGGKSDYAWQEKLVFYDVLGRWTVRDLVFYDVL